MAPLLGLSSNRGRDPKEVVLGGRHAGHDLRVDGNLFTGRVHGSGRGDFDLPLGLRNSWPARLLAWNRRLGLGGHDSCGPRELR